MSKKRQDVTASAEPYISEYDQYAGIYRADPPRIDTENGSFALTTPLSEMFSGQKVLVGGRCRYKTVREANLGSKTPIEMEVSTCYLVQK